MCLDVYVFLSVCLDQVIRMCIQLLAVYLRGGDNELKWQLTYTTPPNKQHQPQQTHFCLSHPKLPL